MKRRDFITLLDSAVAAGGTPAAEATGALRGVRGRSECDGNTSSESSSVPEHIP